MTLALLLVLAGLLPTKESQTVVQPTERPSKVDPVHLWIPSLGGGPDAASALGPKGADPGMTQLYNPRTGVTCTLRILRVGRPVDKEMLAKAPRTLDEKMVHNELSPCVE